MTLLRKLQKLQKPRILGIHSGALGDVIMFARLLSKINGDVTLVTGGEKGQMLKALGAVEQVLDFDLLPIEDFFSNTPVNKSRLPLLLGEYDRVISCLTPDDPKTKLRIGEMCSCSDVSYLPIRPPEFFDGHLVELWSQLLGETFTKKDFATDTWIVNDESQQVAKELLRHAGIDPGEKFVVLHPGAGAKNKCWALKNFIETGRVIHRCGLRPLFILGPVEAERWGKTELDAIQREDGFATIKSPSLSALSALLFLSQSFIGNDSGPGHLSAALGLKTIVLYGLTNAIHFSPLGMKVCVVVNSKLESIKVRDVVGELL